jgi:hypothetical protein
VWCNSTWTYFKLISSSSVTVQRILADRATAVLELRQTVNHAGWAVVLDHQRNGWRAVDLLDLDATR